MATNIFVSLSGLVKNLQIYEGIMPDEIVSQRKNKFLNIGRDKGFISDSENLISRIYETELNIKKNYTNSINIVSDFIINTSK